MTLQKKFSDVQDAYHNRSVECEIIADEFAIGFGEYLDSLTAEDIGDISMKKLLEIYKKEKGL